jgi:hypothetical protein
MASCLALRYALLAFSPVSSHGTCCGLDIACAAALFSPFLILVELPFLAIFFESWRTEPGVGEGDIFTTSAKELGVKLSLWLWP